MTQRRPGKKLLPEIERIRNSSHPTQGRELEKTADQPRWMQNRRDQNQGKRHSKQSMSEFAGCGTRFDGGNPANQQQNRPTAQPAHRTLPIFRIEQNDGQTAGRKKSVQSHIRPVERHRPPQSVQKTPQRDGGKCSSRKLSRSRRPQNRKDCRPEQVKLLLERQRPEMDCQIFLPEIIRHQQYRRDHVSGVR